jgi:7-cyano-7-deazaguanine synthase
MKKAVVLVSGGIDSSTVLAIVEEQEYEIYALSFNYMQRQHVELKKIKQFIKGYNVKEHKILEIDLQAIGGSSLTDSNIIVPKYTKASDIGDSIPSTYVPARNTIFLSYALGYAEVKGASDIFIGVHATDYANYPDCRPEYLKSFETMANLATAAGARGSAVRIHAPLINMSKSDIVAEGLRLGVDFSSTLSCYDPTEDSKSCGKCHACLIRLKAFKDNNKEDPIFYVR